MQIKEFTLDADIWRNNGGLDGLLKVEWLSEAENKNKY